MILYILPEFWVGIFYTPFEYIIFSTSVAYLHIHTYIFSSQVLDLFLQWDHVSYFNSRIINLKKYVTFLLFNRQYCIFIGDIPRTVNKIDVLLCQLYFYCIFIRGIPRNHNENYAFKHLHIVGVHNCLMLLTRFCLRFEQLLITIISAFTKDYTVYLLT